MSASRRGSPITTIVISMILTLALYVLSWPIIELKCTTSVYPTSIHATSPGPAFRGPIRVYPRVSEPRWVSTVYWPLHLLRNAEPEHGLLARYWNWWGEGIWIRAANNYGDFDLH